MRTFADSGGGHWERAIAAAAEGNTEMYTVKMRYNTADHGLVSNTKENRFIKVRVKRHEHKK